MPRYCALEFDPRRATIEVVVASGTRTLKSIAAEFGVSYDTLRRHAKHSATTSAVIAPVGGIPRPTAAPQSQAEALSGPVDTFVAAFGFAPMEHQEAYLNEQRNLICVKGRQVGMSTAFAGLAIWKADSQPGSLVVVVSASQRQSSEVTSRAREGFARLGVKLKADSATQIHLANGSRIVSLPASARAVRGWSADVLCVDESAFVDSRTWRAARATVAATGGRVICQSTAGNPALWFYDLCQNVPDGWAYMRVPSSDAETITPEFLEQERASMSAWEYAQEYEATFAVPETAVDAPLFNPQDIARMFGEEKP